MKPAVAPYQSSATCVRIECVNGTVVRITDYPFDLTMSNATVYKTDYGYSPTAVTSTTTLAPSAMDLEGICAVGGVSRDALASGVFDNARVFIFRTNYFSPVEDYEPLASGFFGKTTLEDDKYRIEGLSLVDCLNQSIGATYTAACANTFGDAGCGITLSLVDVVGAVTHVTSAYVIRDSSRSEAADWFGAGTIAFTTGLNAGLKPLEIRSYAADGTITTFDPFYFPVEVGDTFVMIPGCRKRLEDCRDKWENVAVTSGSHAFKSVPNKGGFFGFSYIPTSSVTQQIGGNR